MRNKTFQALFAALIAGLLVVTGCSLSGPDTSGIEPGKGKLVLSVSGLSGVNGASAGRTILPAVEYKAEVFSAAAMLAYWKAGTGDAPAAVETIEFSTAEYGISLVPGEYVVKVTATIGKVDAGTAWVGKYNSTDDKVDDVVVIEAGKPTLIEAAFSVQDYLDEHETDPGTFAWDLTTFEDADSVEITIFKAADLDDPIDDGELTLAETADYDDGVYKFKDEIELDAGEYLVVFTVVNESGDDSVEWSEVLYIVGGMTSEYKPSFGAVFGEEAEKLVDIVLKAFEDGDISDINGNLFTALGVLGFTSANEGQVKAAIAEILAEEDEGEPVYDAPETLAEVKELVDAALIKAQAFEILEDTVFSSPSTTAAEAAITALVKNGSTITSFDWEAFEDDGILTVVIGAYTLTLSATPPAPLGDIELVTTSHEKWDEIANALVIDNGTSFGAANSFATIVELPIASNISLANYLRLEIDVVTYVDDEIVTSASQYSNDIGYELINGEGVQVNDETNAGNATGALKWSLSVAQKAADFSGGQGKLVIKAGNKTNELTKVVVKSVKFILAPPPMPQVTFSLDVTTLGTSGVYTNATEDGDYDGDGIKVKFSAANDRACFALTTDQIELLMARTNISVTVAGTANTSSTFRYHLGKVDTTTSWNGTDSFTAGAFSTTINGSKVITFSGNKSTETLAYFILQMTGSDTTDVTITSITITSK
ncbi:MAG: hypothetical protein LBB72_01415 [Spirochaetaceae bacterium]|jgi:hypothetical protein|nr:hypothetical protein [Spirochaetaceae bacterium]